MSIVKTSFGWLVTDRGAHCGVERYTDRLASLANGNTGARYRMSGASTEYMPVDAVVNDFGDLVGVTL